MRSCAVALLACALLLLLGAGANAQGVYPPGTVFNAGTAYPNATVQSGSMAGGYFGNGNGHIYDVAVTNSTGYGPVLSAFLGNGDGTFAAPLPYSTTTPGWGSIQAGLNAIYAGPLMSAGSVDLAVTDDYSNLYVIPGNGDGTFGAPISLNQVAYTLSAFPDPRGSGLLDLVTSFSTYNSATQVTKRLPGSIVALLLSTALVAAFHLPIETIGSKFGGIPQGFPHFTLPDFHAEHILPLLPSAFTVALLAAVESLLSAVVADGMSGDRHNSNVELVAQGVANIASPLFGGIPATGAIARTATNIRSGALTPVAGMVHALTLLTILLVAAPLARFVPLATLAAVLFVVAYNMGEWREIGTILRLSKTDIAVWFTTFALTVFADLTVAVGVGMTLAALLYIYRIAETTTVAPVTPEYLEDGQAHILQDKDIPSNVTILRIHGPFLFGTTEKLAEATRDLKPFGDVVILRLRNMTALDATGIHALEQFSDRLHKVGKTLLLCGARDQPSRLIAGSDFLKHVGAENVLPHVQAALARAREVQGDFAGVGRELALELEHRPL